jgi:regulatory protein
VSVFLDGKFAFGLPAIMASRLKRGQVLSDAEIQSLEAEGAVETAYDRTLNYLSYRPRSRAEVERFLQKRGLSEAQIEPVAQRLERAGLLDDEAFARYWVENRERHRPRGLRALRYELRQKGISTETIDRALASVDVPDSAYRSAGRKARQLAHLDREKFADKLVAYLARRGFDYEIARETAGRLWAELAADD